MRAALSGVPAEQRRALVMAGILGLTAAEVAEREGIPLGTAKTRIRSAMRKLRAELAPDEPGRAGS
jgi:RNA polymerase sigma-70 factor (ECF subfamily)